MPSPPDVRRWHLRSRAARFAVGFLIALPAFALLYPVILPAYQEAVLALANTWLAALDPPLEIELAEGAWRAFWVRGEMRFPAREIKASSLHLIYLNLVLLPALLAATPARARIRLFWILVGLLALFAIHVGSVVGIMHADLNVQLHRDETFWRWVSGNLKIGGQLFAVLLWALFTWGYWMSLARSARTAS